MLGQNTADGAAEGTLSEKGGRKAREGGGGGGCV